MPIPLSDPRVRQIVDVVAAVQNSEWIKVLERGGKEVARIVACAALPPGGPLKQPACDLIGKVIDTNGQQFGEVYDALSSGDWWGLIKAVTPLFGPEAACAVIPDNPVKDVACGTLGKLLAEAYQFAADLIGAGVAAVNKLAQLAGLAGSPHMPQEKYEQLYWKTWCHYGTWLCLRNGCSGLGDLYGRIHPACVEYFDSHQMSEDNADKTCDGMQARFDKAVKAYAEAMKAAGGAFAENKRPFARTWAVEDYGKNTSGARRDFIVQNCVFQMRKDFPFPEPIPARCESIKLGLLGGLEGGGLYEKCLKAEKSKMPSPSAWQHTCTGAGAKFSSILEQEKVRLESRIPTFMAAGCLPPMGWTAAQGLKFTCRTYEGYASCLRSLSPGLEQQHCTLDQSKADQRWAQTIAGALGPKRCKAVGLDVSCTRPWKRDACGTMLKEWSAALGVKPAVQCRFDNVTVYQMLIAKAAIIVKTLNGAPGSSPSNCKSTWDPLTIICSDPQVLSRLPELLPSMKFGQCPPDPNKDGADVPCYGGPVQNTAAAGPIFVQQEPKIASGIDLTALPAPHIVRRGGTDPFQWGAAVTIGSEQALSTQDGMCYVGLHFEIQNVGSSASPPFEFTLGAKGSPPAMRRGP